MKRSQKTLIEDTQMWDKQLVFKGVIDDTQI